MIKIALCDDDSSELERIQTQLQIYKEKHDRCLRILTCQQPTQLLTVLESYADTQIVILDIVMPEMNGIALAHRIRALYPEMAIIFLTSSTEYAVDSYSVHADNYLLKPLVQERFFSCLDAIFTKVEAQEELGLTVVCKDGLYRVSLPQLVYCEVRNRSTFLHLASGRTLVTQMIFTDLLDKLLPHRQFLKPHRSFAVNLDYVDQISAKEITLHNGELIPIAKGNATVVRQAFLEYYSS